MAATKKTVLTPNNPDEEIWELQIPGTVYIQTLAPNNFGQMVPTDRTLGPNKKGLQFRISKQERTMNQQRVADQVNDPFKNGILVRCDASQQEDAATASTDAMTGSDLLAMLEQNGAVFDQSLEKLSEINLRRLYDLAVEMDASHSQVNSIVEFTQARFAKGWAQDLDKPVRLYG